MIDFEPKFNKFFPYKTEVEEQTRLKEIVAEVVQIYQQFLTAKVHSAGSIESLQKRGFYWANESREKFFPSRWEVKHFCAILKRSLVLKVNSIGSVQLSTGYAPEKLLQDCLLEAGITREKYPDFVHFFPYKSCTVISCTFNRTSSTLGYSLRVNFSGPSF